MKLNDINPLQSFRKKTASPSIQETNSKHSKPNRLMSSRSYISKPKQSPLQITQYEKGDSFATERNGCIEGKDCPNFLRLHSLMTRIEKQRKQIEELSNLNDFFIYTLNQKDSMYRTLLQESNIVKLSSSSKEKVIFTPQVANPKPKPMFMSPNKRPQSHIKYGFLPNAIQPPLNPKEASTAKHQKNKSLIDIKPSNKQIHPTHYENLIRISNKASKNSNQHSSISFLSMTPSMLREYETNEYVDFLTKLTRSKEDFTSLIKGEETAEFLSDLRDSIGNVLKDFKQLLRLLLKIKLYLASSNELISNMLMNTSTDLILSKACKFLNCEQSLLYLYDPISDMLDVYRNDEGKQGKLAKDYGLIGHCFSKGEVVKVDDPANDAKFKRESEMEQKQTRRNTLCYPLAVYDEEPFGVIEAADKRNTPFTNDDEELMTGFANLISVLIACNSRNDEYNKTITRYEKLILYSLELTSIQNKDEFNEKTELLLNALFHSTNSRLLFVNNTTGQLLHRNRVFTPKINLGIVSYVLKRKECHACFKAKNCSLHNTLIDIDTSDAIVTYPLLIDHECIAIVQIILNDQMDNKREMPREREMKLLNLIEKCIINWYKSNKDHIFD